MNYFASVDSGTRADVDQPIRSLDCVLIVFDHDQCVSQVSKFLKSLNQAQIVSLMQTDRWLVQHVKNSREAGTDLGRESYSLSFSSGQRTSGTLQG